MKEFFTSVPVMLIIGLLGITIAVMLGRVILKGICWLLFTAEAALTEYCERHRSSYSSYLMAGAFAAAWFLFTIPMESPLNNWKGIPLLRIAGCVLVACPLVKIMLQAKLHAPLVLLVKLISVPFHILCLVVGTVCAFLSCLPEPKKEIIYTTVDELGRMIFYQEKDEYGNPIPIKIIDGPETPSTPTTPRQDFPSPTPPQDFPIPTSGQPIGWQDWGDHGRKEHQPDSPRTAREDGYRPFDAKGEYHAYDSDYEPME